MSKYVAALDGEDRNVWQKIINEDTVFHNCVNKYKQIMTHYLAEKSDLWHTLVLYPLFRMEKVLQTIDFVKSMSAINFHLLGYLDKVTGTTDPATKKLVSSFVADLADAVNYTLADLDQFINLPYTPYDKF